MTIARRRSPGVVVMAAIVALAGCVSVPDDATPSTTVSPSPSSPGATEPSAEASATPIDAGEGEVTSVFEFEVGDCFSANTDQVASVIVVHCDRPHAYEVFHIYDHEAGPDDVYPGDEAIVDYADTQCQSPFEEYVGIDYQSSIWYIASVTPSAETWAEGDREIICTLDQQDQDGVAIEVTGSAAGSAE